VRDADRARCPSPGYSRAQSPVYIIYLVVQYTVYIVVVVVVVVVGDERLCARVCVAVFTRARPGAE